MIAAATALRRPDEIFVWPDMRNAVTVFLNLSTQWRAGFAGLMGLEYQAIKPTAELLGLELKPSDLLDIRTMESAALAEFERKRKK